MIINIIKKISKFILKFIAVFLISFMISFFSGSVNDLKFQNRNGAFSDFNSDIKIIC